MTGKEEAQAGTAPVGDADRNHGHWGEMITPREIRADNLLGLF
jgi:hypothetical protein